MKFDRQSALQAGYTPQEIDSYLATKQPQQGGFLSKVANAATDIFVPQTKKFIQQYPEFVKGAITSPPKSAGEFIQRLGQGAKMGLKTGAEVASFGVPFGKGAGLATKALLPGAAVGALTSASRGEDVVRGTLGGAAGAGVLGVLGKGVSKVTGSLPKKIMSGVFKEPIKATKAAIKKGETLGEQALKRGEVGTTEGIYKKALTKTQELEDQLQNLLFGSNQKVSTGNVKKMLKPFIDDLTQAGNKTDAQSILNRITEIERVSGKNIPASRANEIKRALYDEVRRNYGVQGAAGTELIKNLARSFKEEIGKVPGVAEINKDLSYYGRVANSMADKLAREDRNNLLSLTDAILGAGGLSTGFGLPAIGLIAARKIGGSTIGKTTGANILKTLGKAGENPLISKIAGQTGARGGAGIIQSISQKTPGQTDYDSYQGQEPHAPIVPQQGKETLSDDGFIHSSDGNIYSQDKQWIWNQEQDDWLPNTETQAQPSGLTGVPSKEQFQQAILSDLQSGGKNVTELQSVYKLFYPEESQAAIPAQTKGLAQTGIRGVTEVRKMYQKDPNLLTKQLVPGQFISRTFDSALYDTVDALLRLRTGAQANPSEIRGYMTKLGPTFGDTSEDVEYKLQQLERDFNYYLGQ